MKKIKEFSSFEEGDISVLILIPKDFKRRLQLEIRYKKGIKVVKKDRVFCSGGLMSPDLLKILDEITTKGLEEINAPPDSSK